jgi:hypothetical protein
MSRVVALGLLLVALGEAPARAAETATQLAATAPAPERTTELATPPRPPDPAARPPVVARPEPLPVTAAPAPAPRGRTDLRLEVGELLASDPVPSNRLSYSELRVVGESSGLLGMDESELQLDARRRQGWTAVSPDQTWVSRLFLRYGGEQAGWLSRVGRQIVGAAAGAPVDGVWSGLAGRDWEAGVFGGLRPHPLTTALDSRFATAGLSYEVRGRELNHSGGVVAQLYRGQLDRLYVSERGFASFGRALTGYASATVDFLSPKGLLDGSTSLRGPTGLDLSNGQLRLRYRPEAPLDVTLALGHFHTILPRLWWDDWLAQERARHGIVTDGLEPVGTRQSNATLTINVPVARAVTPYLVTRYDARHTDGSRGYEVRPGLKVLVGDNGYVNAFYAYRRYFTALASQGGFDLGVDLSRFVALDASVTGYWLRRLGGGSISRLVDLSAGVRFGLGAMARSLEELDVMTQYQGLVDGQTVTHIGWVRLTYRYRDGGGARP